MPRLLNVPRWIIVLVIILAIGLAAALSIRFFGGIGSSRSAENFSGSVVLQIPQPWTAPTGEVVSGLVTYTPKTGAVSYVMPPARAQDLRIAGFSPERGEVLAVRKINPELIRFTTADQHETVVVTAPQGGTLGVVDWTKDGAVIVYGMFSSATAAPQMRLVRTDGLPPLEIGEGMPLGFSPDGESLLAFFAPSYVIVRSDGTRTDVTGLPTPQTTPDLRFSSSRSFVALQEVGAPVRIFAIDWAAGKVTSAGEIALPVQGGWGFGADDSLLVVASDALVVYDLTSGQPVRRVSYQGAFPSDAMLLTQIP